MFYAILYIIGGALMAKEAGDLDKKYFVPILNVTVDGCKVNDCDILKGCAVSDPTWPTLQNLNIFFLQ